MDVVDAAGHFSELASLARRYEALEVLARPLPRRRGKGRVRTLRLDTSRIVDELVAGSR